MSVLHAIRDTAASLSLDKCLQRVRDEQMRRMLAGQPMSEQELRDAEHSAVLWVAKKLYNDDTVTVMALNPRGRVVDHRKQYAERATAAADMAILLSHQHLCRLPIVGDPAWAPT